MNNDKTQVEKSIELNATRERIWSVLLNKSSFEDWCSAFHPGSTFEGDWTQGSLMRFIGPDPDSGEIYGMITKIAEHRPNEYLRGEHVGVIEKGKDIFEGEDQEKWIGGTETYQIIGDSAPFTLSVQASTPPEMYDFFFEAWGQALARLKQLVEA